MTHSKMGCAVLILVVGGGAACGGMDGIGQGGAGAGGQGGAAGSSSLGGAGASGTAGGSAGTAGGGTDNGTDCGKDSFGVFKRYCTVPGGREWVLPASGAKNAEWSPDSASPTSEMGVVRAGNGSPRVQSPAGTVWWRNVEMTTYVRFETTSGGSGARLSLYPRSERQSNADVVAANQINGGVPDANTDPAAHWPGYPFSGSVNSHCLAASYRGDLYPDGHISWVKELSHPGGYSNTRGDKSIFAGGVPANQWIGYKVVVRNENQNRGVHMETWIDPKADGNWTMAISVDDTGGWTVSMLNGCDQAPFSYAPDELVTWGAPYATFRDFYLTLDFKQMSVREIAPLP